MSDYYDYYKNQIDPQTLIEIQERAEERAGMCFDPGSADAENLAIWTEELHAYGDAIAEVLRAALDEIAMDIQFWVDEANQWEEDTNVVIRWISDTVGRAELTTHWDAMLGEAWVATGLEVVDSWSNDRDWKLGQAAFTIRKASEALEEITTNWNEYHERTQDGAKFGMEASQLAIKVLSNRIVPGSGSFVVEFVDRMNNL